MDEQLIVIRTNQEINSLIEYLQDKDFVAFDTETTGVTKDSEIIGYSLCAEPGIGIYVITAYWDVATQSLHYLETKETAKQVMEILATKKLIMHNGVFDCSMVENNYKVSLIDALHTDTMILAHVLDENRRVGLKELGAAYYGQSAKKEQEEMHESVYANGGVLTKELYELYKANADLIAKYGAKDAILTYNIFHEMVPLLFEEKLDKFFYEEESMPLLRGPTYDMNTTGMKVDSEALADLKKTLEIQIHELKAYIYHEITPHIKDKYPGTSKKGTFNIGSGQQLSWLLFDRLGNVFPKVSNSGQDLARSLGLKTPYTNRAKLEFIDAIKASKGTIWKGSTKVRDWYAYLSTDKTALGVFATKYKWVDKLLEYKKLTKLLSTYVEGIQRDTKFGIIQPNFLQHGTTSGRYSCRHPNFQNLPRDDKRIKGCIIPRPGRVFVGSDQSQLEPRVFASQSKDERLQRCFENGDDFYSVIGMEIFDKYDCSVKKSDENSFAKKYHELREIAKKVALSATYGTTPPKMAPLVGKSIEECKEIIDRYFEQFPSVRKFMLESHEAAKKDGRVVNLYGRPRRMPKAKEIYEIYGNTSHENLPYTARNLLNLAVNHRVQSSGASIMNRVAIRLHHAIRRVDPTARLVLQVHDSVVVECRKGYEDAIFKVMQDCMENTVTLPGVRLEAVPKIGYNLAEV